MLKRVFGYLLVFSYVVAQNVTSEEPLVLVEDGSEVPAKGCVSRVMLENSMESVLDDLVAFGITDEHADEFTSWIMTDVVLTLVESMNSSTPVMCFPPTKTDEMGTRLGNMIAQDIAGERPSKRGRHLDIDTGLLLIPVDTPPNFELDTEIENQIETDSGNSTEEEEAQAENGADELPNAEEHEGELQANEPEQTEISSGDGNEDNVTGEEETEDNVIEDEETEDIEWTERKTNSWQKTKNPFSFSKTKWTPPPKKVEKCCKCPKNHYPFEARVKNKSCSKGPCCPQLCRTLERLAGMLSSARYPCCQKANRDCIKEDRKVEMKLVWNKRKVFNFDLSKMKNQVETTRWKAAPKKKW